MKNITINLLLCLSVFFFTQCGESGRYEVISPDGKLRIKLNIEDSTQYEIWHGETQLISPSIIALRLQNGTIIGNGTVKNTEKKKVKDVISVPFGKNKTLDEVYNELTIHYNEGYDLIVRAYNEGVAYRLKTDLDEEIIIETEDLIYNLVGDPVIYFPESPDLRNFEKTYVIYNSANDIQADKFSVSPVLLDYKHNNLKLVVTEADNYDYPGLYVEPNGENSLRGMWAKYPETVEEPDNIYNVHLPITRYDYIARTHGQRIYPWRVFAVSDDEKSLLNNELVYMLAEPQRLTDISWIKPGKSAWEWWHKAMLEDVDFPVGFSNLGLELYKYYVDFAAENNIEYVTLDAGWNESYIQELCEYADTKNVKIFLWTWASMPLENPNYLERLKKLGVYGMKIDFFERNDQPAMRWGHELAQKLADLEMIALYHGCPVPSGLNRTYPNILNFEAVRGAECNYWDSGSDPAYHVQFPLIRLLAGPIDYTPGSMRNKTKEEFFPIDKPDIIPSSMGTRAHEVAMFVVFDHWVGYLCDSPTEYRKYPDILDFLSTVPTVWDKTVPLDAKLSEYVLVAKQTGKDWYVGGMSNWDARKIDVDFDFLEDGISYKALILKDADDSDVSPTNYVGENLTIKKGDKMNFSMAKGGGFVIRLIAEK